tara:strand:- start:4518 stop:6641 length:2124 start_codon:yes stop_codon:yes gene_type:complete
MSFESDIQDYSNSIMNAANASAQRLAEGGNLGDEARQAVAQIVGPLGLDMLKEGIMAKAGVSSALRGQSGKNIRAQVESAFNAKLNDLKAQTNARVQSALSKGKAIGESNINAVRGAAQGNASRAMDIARQAGEASVAQPIATAKASLNKGRSVAQQSVEQVQENIAARPVLSKRQNRAVEKEARTDPTWTNKEQLRQLSDPAFRDVKAGSLEQNQKIRDKIVARKQDEILANNRAQDEAINRVGDGGVSNIEQGEQARITNSQGSVGNVPEQGARANAAVVPEQEQQAGIAQRQSNPEDVYNDTVANFKAHVDSRINELKTRLTADPETKVVIAGKEGEGTNIGTENAVTQFKTFTSNNNLAKNPGPEIQKYTADQLQKLHDDPTVGERVSFGRVKNSNQIKDNEIHVWGANTNNANLADGEPVAQSDGGQARVIAQGSPREVGIVSTPLTGVPTTKSTVTEVSKPTETLGGAKDNERVTTAPSKVSVTEGRAPVEGLSFGQSAALRTGDALTTAGALVGIGYSLADKNLSAGQKAVSVTEQVAPAVAEKALGDVLPGIGLVVSGVEDAATPGLGSAGQRATDFASQAGTLIAAKAVQKGVNAAQSAWSGASGTGGEGADLAGEGGTELSTFGETGAVVETGADSTDAVVEGGLLASGPESGGLGFVAAGVVALGITLASIFGGHSTPTPPPAPNIARVVQNVGLR